MYLALKREPRAEKLQDFDFHHADRIDVEAYNRVLWAGTMGDVPYPTTRSGPALRKNRTQLLKTWAAGKHARRNGFKIRSGPNDSTFRPSDCRENKRLGCSSI